MRSLMIAASIGIATCTASAAVAQSWTGQRGVSVADQHRFETERLRQRSREQADFARQSQSGARLAHLELEAARAPEPYVRLEPTIPQTPDAGRRSNEATVSGVTRIDDWLARAPQ